MPARKKIKLVIDPNWWVSASISQNSRNTLSNLIFDDRYIIFYCDELVDEYYNTMSYPKFSKYKNSTLFFEDVKPILFKAEINKFVSLSRDTNDDYLLSLSLTVNADFLITGDRDLLVIESIGKTKILKMGEFIKL